jgi:hypothetical protein
MQVITSLPISTACGFCGNNVRLAYVDPTGTNAVCAYRCVDGHHHEILRADQSAPSVIGLAIVRSEGPVPPGSALKSDLPLSSVTLRDWPSICVASVLRPSVGRRGDGGARRSRATKGARLITPSHSGVAGRNYCTAATFT